MVYTALPLVRAWQVHHLLLRHLIGLNDDKQYLNEMKCDLFIQCNFMNSRNTVEISINFIRCEILLSITVPTIYSTL